MMAYLRKFSVVCLKGLREIIKSREEDRIRRSSNRVPSGNEFKVILLQITQCKLMKEEK
jgi:hypothetical protein